MGKAKNDGRPRGVLTDRDRTFLQLSEEGQKEEYSPSARSRARQDIKERVWYGFLDGETLFQHITADQRRAIFDGWKEYAEPDPNPPDDEYKKRQNRGRAEMVEQLKAEAGFSSWISFLYLGLSESDEFNFQPILERGIKEAERSRGRVVTDLDFDVDTRERGSLDELAERLERREKLTTEEIQRLRAADVLEDDELIAYYDERPDPIHGDGEE